MSFCGKQQLAKMVREEGFEPSKLADITQENLDPDLMAALLDAVRKWEAKSGPIVSATHRDPERKRQNYENVHRAEYEQNPAGLLAHPFLKDLSKYDGIDPDMNPLPTVNPTSEEALQNKLELALKPGQRPRFNPTLKPY